MRGSSPRSKRAGIPDRAARPADAALSAGARSTTWSGSTIAAPATRSRTPAPARRAPVAFVSLANAASTVDARRAGYREALHTFAIPVDHALTSSSIRPTWLRSYGSWSTQRPDGIVCANDRTAGLVMHTLLSLGLSVPGRRPHCWHRRRGLREPAAGAADHAATAVPRNRDCRDGRDARARDSPGHPGARHLPADTIDRAQIVRGGPQNLVEPRRTPQNLAEPCRTLQNQEEARCRSGMQ